MTPSTPAPSTEHAPIEVTPVAGNGWRLRDRTHRESDPRGLLGYVEEDDTGFHAVWLTPVVQSEDFPSLKAAIAVAGAHCAEPPRRADAGQATP